MSNGVLNFSRRGRRSVGGRAGVAIGVAGASLVGAAAAVILSRHTRAGGPARGCASATVRAEPQEVYLRWRDLPKLPQVMPGLREVRTLDVQRSRWTAEDAVGGLVTWDAEIIEDRPGEVLAWHSLPGADQPHWGRVTFSPARNGGTRIRLERSPGPNGGGAGWQDNLGALLAGRTPRQAQVHGELRRFKRLVENAG